MSTENSEFVTHTCFYRDHVLDVEDCIQFAHPKYGKREVQYPLNIPRLIGDNMPVTNFSQMGVSYPCLPISQETVSTSDRRYPETIGIEASCIHNVALSNSDTSQDKEDAYCRRAALFGRYLFPFVNIHSDCGAVEFSSPVAGTEHTMLGYWNLFLTFKQLYNHCHTEKLVNKHSFIRNGAIHHVGTGGLHIHMGMPRYLEDYEMDLFKHNMLSFFINRPYVFWLFQEWYKNGCDFLGHIKKYNANTPDEIMRHARNYRCNSVSIRDSIANYRDITMTTEFRCFETPETFEDLTLLIDFVIKAQAHIVKLSLNGSLIPFNVGRALNYKHYSVDKMRDEYKYFFGILGLDGETYLERYFENYELRRANKNLNNFKASKVLFG